MFPQPQPAAPRAQAKAAPVVEQRPVQKRWPMAASILGAVTVSLLLWAGIFWLITALLNLAG